MQIKDFFKVEREKEKTIFISCNINDVELIVNDCVDYFFDEKTIFAYFKSLEENIIFEPTKENYASLFRNLEYFIDDDVVKTRNDKIGKIGEYMLSIILLDFFRADCIIPKLIYITDNNMPIYGIDTLFYSSERDLLLFGESKFTSDINSGIDLLNKSLTEYEQQLNDELRLIVNNNAFKKSKNKFVKEFAGPGDLAISFKGFVRSANLNSLGIPLFVCHGKEISKEEIFDAFDRKLNKREIISGMAAKYLIISMPINDKTQFVTMLKNKLIAKQKDYGRLSR